MCLPQHDAEITAVVDLCHFFGGMRIDASSSCKDP